MDRLRALSWFSKVVELESFSAAATALGVSKAAVSKEIARLEADLGATLLHRTTRSVRPTATGRTVFTRCRGLLDQMQEIEAAAKLDRVEPFGTLRVSVPIALGLLHLKGALSTYMRAYPSVQLELSLTDRFVRIAEEGYDVAIRVATQPDDQDVIATRLSDVRMVACASRDYLARAGRPKTPRDLPKHACLAYAAPGTSGRVPWRFGADKREQTIWIEPVVRADSSLLLRDLAIASHGIALLPSFVCDRELKSGALIELLEGAAPEGRNIFVMFPSTLRTSAKVQTFVRALRSAFGKLERDYQS
ncbi:MAG: LysR family transcriptional regulator [Polyangiaceae bacterium]|nr:LysR family transcriptional regulator [Polyangiaceae bacterium]